MHPLSSSTKRVPTEPSLTKQMENIQKRAGGRCIIYLHMYVPTSIYIERVLCIHAMDLPTTQPRQPPGCPYNSAMEAQVGPLHRTCSLSPSAPSSRCTRAQSYILDYHVGWKSNKWAILRFPLATFFSSFRSSIVFLMQSALSGQRYGTALPLRQEPASA